jgi:Holliday junction resolvasome RuvABC ATP-dependent DNA helicase subunit
MIRIAWMASQRDPAIKMTGEGLRALADASHGIPRTVVNLVAYLKAHMAARGLVIGNSPTVRAVLAKYEIDENGLTLPHRRYLEVLQEYDAATKQPCPLNWFVAKLSSNEGTVREIEQELIRMGLIAKASRGRVLTAKGRAYRLEISHGV